MKLYVCLEHTDKLGYLMHKVKVHPEMEIRALKNLLYPLFHILPENQKLTVCGQTLKDNDTLAKYPQIQNSSLLKLIVEERTMSEDDKLFSLIEKHIRPHYSTEDSVKIMSEFKKELLRSDRGLSLDDYESLAKTMLANNEERNNQLKLSNNV